MKPLSGRSGSRKAQDVGRISPDLHRERGGKWHTWFPEGGETSRKAGPWTTMLRHNSPF